MVSLTPSGKKLARRVQDQLSFIEERALKGLTRTQIDFMIEVLSRVGESAENDRVTS